MEHLLVDNAIPSPLVLIKQTRHQQRKGPELCSSTRGPGPEEWLAGEAGVLSVLSKKKKPFYKYGPWRSNFSHPLARGGGSGWLGFAHTLAY